MSVSSVTIQLKEKFYPVSHIRRRYEINALPLAECQFVSSVPIAELGVGIDVNVVMYGDKLTQKTKWLVTKISVSRKSKSYSYKISLSSHFYQAELVDKPLVYFYRHLQDILLELSQPYIKPSVALCDACNHLTAKQLVISQDNQSHFSLIKQLCQRFSLVFINSDYELVNFYCSHRFDLKSYLAIGECRKLEVTMGQDAIKSHYQVLTSDGFIGQLLGEEIIQTIADVFTLENKSGYKKTASTSTKSSLFNSTTFNAPRELLEVDLKGCHQDRQGVCKLALSHEGESTDIQVKRLLPVAGAHGELSTLPLYSLGKGLMYVDRQLVDEPIVIASLYEQNSIRGCDGVIKNNQSAISFTTLKDHLHIGGDMTSLAFKRVNNAIYLKAQNQLSLSMSEMKVCAKKQISQLDEAVFKALDGRISFKAREKLLLYAKEEADLKAHKVNFNSDTNYNVQAEKLCLRANKSMTLDSGSQVIASKHTINLEAEQIRLVANKAITLGTADSHLIINGNGATIHANHCSYPVLLAGQVGVANVASSQIDQFIPFESLRQVALVKSFIRRKNFLCVERPAYMLHEDIKLSFLVSNPLSRVLKTTVSILMCVPKTETCSLRASLYDRARESYHFVDDIQTEIKANYSGEVNLVWKIKKPPSVLKDSPCYFRFQVKVENIVYPNVSRGMELLKQLRCQHIGYRQLYLVTLKRDCRYLINAIEPRCSFKPESNQFTISYVPLSGQSSLYLSADDSTLEVIDKGSNKSRSCFLIDCHTEHLIDEIDIPTLMTPVIANFRKENNLNFLTNEELEYFSKRKQVVIFVHGFNIKLGKFATYDDGQPITVYRDDKRATGAHHWLTSMESNINQSKSISLDSKDYLRLLLVTWPGDTELSIDYINSVNTSYRLGRRLKKLLDEIKTYDPAIEINVIAHSQGNALLYSALNHIVRVNAPYDIEQVIFWQAALPYDSLKKSQQTKPGVLAKVKRALVLYSKGDNILGEIDESVYTPHQFVDALAEKPLLELTASVFLTYLGLGSLYQLATWLSFPAHFLFSESEIDTAWLIWRKAHPEVMADGDGNHLCATLNQQLMFYDHCGLLKKFSIMIREKLSCHRQQIQSLLAYVSKPIAELTIRAIYVLLTHQDIFVELIENYAHTNVGTCADNNYPLSLIFKMVCFSHVLMTTFKLNHHYAMGWYGVDEESQQDWQGVLRSVDLSRWYHHHS